MAGDNIEYLREYGPSTLEELPNQEVKARDRAAGVQVFRLRYTSGGTGNSFGGHLSQIYHLDRDREAVVRKFLEENPDFVENQNQRSFHQLMRAQGQSWVEAAKAVSGEYMEMGMPENAGGPQGNTHSHLDDCPLSGEFIEGALHAHTQECEGS